MHVLNSIATPSIRADYLAFGRPDFGDEEIAAVTRVLRSGWVGMGPEVIAFEQELAAFVGAPHVVTVNSCTSALHLALLVNGVGPGDEVIVPSLTWCSTANAALYVGARPVFCDIDRATLCSTTDLILSQLGPRTKAVVVVHFGGIAVDVAELRQALPPRVAIIEDAAHALGASYRDGRHVGSSGNLVCFSFYANKNLSTGDGGAIALNDPALAERIRSLRQHGLPANAWQRFTQPQTLPPHLLTELGYKMNYTDLQAAIGRVQLRRQGEFAAHRLAIARHYAAALSRSGVCLQTDCTDAGHARHLFVIRLSERADSPERDTVLRILRQRNIGASVHYPPLHRMVLYRHPSSNPLPVTEAIAGRLLTLPIGASMTLADAAETARHFLEILAKPHA
jgi:dTDP-4-amino-4,6-dideoxygalactose transaminase